MASKLSPKQKRFIEEYQKDKNATQAYVRAGFKDTPSARVQACRLLAKDNIKAEVQRLDEKRSEQTGIDALYILTEAVKMYQKLSADTADEEGNVKTRDATNAKAFLEMAGKVVGAFEKDNQQKADLKHTLKAEGMDGWSQIFPTIKSNLKITPNEN